MKTYQGIMKGAALSVSFIAMALTVACGGSKGGSAPAATAQCINGECTVGQQTALGYFQGRGTGRAYVNGAQGQETMLMTVSSFSSTNTAQQYNNNYNYNYNYNQSYNSGSISLSGTVNVRTGYALMMSQTSSNRSPSASAVCYDYLGAYDCNTGFPINNNVQQQNCYYDQFQGRQICNGNNGGVYGNCQIPVGDYTITTIAQGTSMGSSYGGSASFNNVRIRMTGPATIDATINNGSLGTTYGNQIGRFTGSMTIQTMNSQSCNTSVQIQ